METLTREECFIGLEVVLSKPDPNYLLTRANPAVGTEWECSGVVKRIGDNVINVHWANGENNTYKTGELSSICEGKCISIW